MESCEGSSKRGCYHKYNQEGYDTKLAYAVRPRKRKIITTSNIKVNYYYFSKIIMILIRYIFFIG